MTMWMMAAAGWLRGDVDPIAIRLPSVIAVVLTSLLVYAYARVMLSQTVAIAAALVYATFGQVLQIGRLGESEALFALLVSGIAARVAPWLHSRLAASHRMVQRLRVRRARGAGERTASPRVFCARSPALIYCSCVAIGGTY